MLRQSHLLEKFHTTVTHAFCFVIKQHKCETKIVEHYSKNTGRFFFLLDDARHMFLTIFYYYHYYYHCHDFPHIDRFPS